MKYLVTFAASVIASTAFAGKLTMDPAFTVLTNDYFATSTGAMTSGTASWTPTWSSHRYTVKANAEATSAKSGYGIGGRTSHAYGNQVLRFRIYWQETSAAEGLPTSITVSLTKAVKFDGALSVSADPNNTPLANILGTANYGFMSGQNLSMGVGGLSSSWSGKKSYTEPKQTFSLNMSNFNLILPTVANRKKWVTEVDLTMPSYVAKAENNISGYTGTANAYSSMKTTGEVKWSFTVVP